MNLLALLRTAHITPVFELGSDRVTLCVSWSKKILEELEVIDPKRLEILFGLLVAEVTGLKQFRNTVREREQSWRDSEAKYGASIDDCIMFLRVQLSDLQKDRSKGAAYLGVTSKLFLNCIERLEELDERRDVGGAQPSEAERRRETDSAAWREEEVYGDRRREQQERDRFRTGGRRDETSWRAGSFEQTDYVPEPPRTRTEPPWWKVLNLPIDASVSEIKTAARRLRAKYHPDRYKGEDAHIKMAEINVALDEALASRL